MLCHVLEVVTTVTQQLEVVPAERALGVVHVLRPQRLTVMHDQTGRAAALTQAVPVRHVGEPRLLPRRRVVERFRPRLSHGYHPA